MAVPVSAPVSTTVFAFDIVGADLFAGRVQESFEKVVVATARGLGFVTQDPGKPNVILTLAPEAVIAEALSRITAALAGFNAAEKPLRARAVGHYGVVFRSEADGQVSFSGSAIRSTQSALRRAPGNGNLMATRDLAVQAAKLTDIPFRFEAMSDAAGAEGLTLVVAGASAAAQDGVGFNLSSNDPAFVAFVKRRLAMDIGPFAGALVDRALRSSAVATQLVKVLSREIENPVARITFEKDVFEFIKSQNTI